MPGVARQGEDGPAKTLATLEHSSSGYGAIAQLGERVLCKHEVVGSIPSGSTTLRPPGFAWRSQTGARRARRSSKSEDGLSLETRSQTIVRETSLRMSLSPHQDYGMRDF